MSFIATAIAGSAVIGGAASIYGASQQSKSAQQAQQTLQQGQTQALGQIQHFLGPYASAGQDMLPQLKALLTPGPSQTSTLKQLPGFQFMKDIATEGVQAGAGRAGFSGTTALNAGTVGTNLAESNWASLVNPLLSLYQSGAGAAGQAGQASAATTGAFAPNIAQTQIGQGNVLAGGAQGVAGAVGGATSGITNLALLNALTGGKMTGQYGGQPFSTGAPPVPYLSA